MKMVIIETMEIVGWDRKEEIVESFDASLSYIPTAEDLKPVYDRIEYYKQQLDFTAEDWIAQGHANYAIATTSSSNGDSVELHVRDLIRREIVYRKSYRARLLA